MLQWIEKKKFKKKKQKKIERVRCVGMILMGSEMDSPLLQAILLSYLLVGKVLVYTTLHARHKLSLLVHVGFQPFVPIIAFDISHQPTSSLSPF